MTKSKIPKPTKPQPLLAEAYTFSHPGEKRPSKPLPKVAKEPPFKRSQKIKRPPKPKPPAPTLASKLTPRFENLRERRELKIDRLSAYRGTISMGSQIELVKESLLDSTIASIYYFYIWQEKPSLTDIESNISLREIECKKLKELTLSASARDAEIIKDRIAFLQAEIATFQVIFEYVKRAFSDPEKTEKKG